MERESVDWRETYTELLPKVFHYFCYRVGDRTAAEDLTSATFEKAWRGRERYDKRRAAFSSWLFGIARNVAADYRRHNRKVAIPLDENQTHSHNPSLESATQRKADFERLAFLLNQLPARQQELISLKYGAELTNRAIAALTGLSESNVGTILHRAVKRLRAEWELEDE